MNANRFEALARSLTALSSRRGVAEALAGLTLGGLLGPLLGLGDTEARKHKKKRRKKRKPSCSDGKRNGSETDVDCGGGCPRCADGKSCFNSDDCASAVCTGGTCQECSADGTACDAGLVCSGGVCAVEPQCVAAGTNCAMAALPPACVASCCSPPTNGLTCGQGSASRPCLSGADCLGGQCIGFVCT